MIARVLFVLVAIGALCGAAAPVAAAAPPVEVYGQLPRIQMVKLSPKGDKIAYVTVQGSDRHLLVTGVDGKTLHQVDCQDIKLRDLAWADDDHVVLSATMTMQMNNYSSDDGEFLAVLALNVARHSLIVIFSNQSELLPLVFGEYGFSAADGHAYGYFGGIRRANIRLKGAAFVDLYRVDLDTDAKLELAPGGYKQQSWLVDPLTGEAVATSLHDERSGEWRIEAQGAVLAKGRADFGPARVLGLGRAPGSLLVAEPTSGDDLIREARMDGGGVTDVEGGERIADFLLDRRTNTWIGSTDSGDQPVTRFFATADESKWQTSLGVVADKDARFISSSDDFGSMILFTQGDRDSGTYWLVDTAAKTKKQIGQQYPDIPADQVGSVSMVDWTAPDGLAMHGALTLPPGRPAHNLPLVVLPHGGPQARDYANFDWWAQAFAARGYAVFQPNFRGSAGYGNAFVSAGYGEWGRKMQTDISDGVAALAHRGVVDPKRACIVGASYGGYAALAGVTVQQGLYRCSVSWGGVSDLPAMLLSEARAGRSYNTDATRYWRRFMGADGRNGGDLDSVSPAKLAGRADAPILLMYGHDDTVVPPNQSIEMSDALKRAGKAFELKVMPGEDHWLSRGATRTAMLSAAVAFVQKYNPAD